MLFRRLSLRRVFTVKQSRVKSSDTATYLRQKPKFKSRQIAGGFRVDFFSAPLSKEEHFIGLLTFNHYRAF